MAKTESVQNLLPMENIYNDLGLLSDQLGKEIYNAFKTTIIDFYNSYPKTQWYDRTLSLRYAYTGIGGKNKFSRKLKTGAYRCGVMVGAEYMDGDPYVRQHHAASMDGIVDKAWVFPRAFDKGIHGFTQGEVNTFNAGKKAKDMWRVRAPKKASPTPLHNMKERYKEIDDGVDGRIDAIIRKYLP